MDRRSFLRMSVAGGVAVAAASWPLRLARAAPGPGPYGPLQTADANGILLPEGFRSRVVATTGQVVPGSSYTWHAAPDGGACFPTGTGGWLYTSNSELATPGGGAGALEFGPDGTVVGARRILSGTDRNCAGGPTPWGTWLSCEEVSRGAVWECDPRGAAPAVRRPGMGLFTHEAAAVDPVGRAVYLTEDRTDGALYRFRPISWPDLAEGQLEVLTEAAGSLSWQQVPDPSGVTASTRYQVAGTKRFNGGEGAWFDGGKVFFATKGDNRVWTYDPAANALAVVYDVATSPTPVLTGVDNVTVAPSGDVFVAEDGGDMELAILSREGEVAPFLRLTVVGSELTGPAFDPSGARLYFSSQRDPGRTYEVTGPFRSAATSPTSTTTTTATSTTTVPEPPAFALSARGGKVKGVAKVDLTWSGAVGSSVDVLRDGRHVATTSNDGAHTDAVGGKGARSYAYRLREPVGGRLSNEVVVTF